MIDAFVVLSPILLLAVLALLGLLGCNQVLGLNPTKTALPDPILDQTWGSPAGGTKVVITEPGVNTGATVTFGGAAADPEFLTYGAGQVTVGQTPRHSPGAVDVVVTNPDGSPGTAKSAFTYGITERAVVVNSAISAATLQLAPIDGQLVVLAVLWSGTGTLTLTTNPPTNFTRVNQDDLPPQGINVAIFFSNNVQAAVQIRGDLAGSSSPNFSMVATGYDFVDTNLALTQDQFKSAQGNGTSVALPLPISDLAPGDLIYAAAVSRNSGGALAGGITAPASDATIITRTKSPIPAYFLVDDHVVLPADVQSPPYTITANTTDPAGSWYVFGLRIRVATS
ncbi:MAG TPA: IPT/TIG domain-containing protein [Terriglobales bacterium]|nr:IPT/TIG domain-containing protein [Terriglobales bacterium]